jgi:sensor histidine kinase YesM
MTYDIKAEDFSVLPLSIQPLVENAIRHGVHKRGRKGGRVVLRTWSEEDARIVEVEDTGVGFDVENIQEEVAQGKRDSTGLSNIRFRLEKVMGAKLEIHSVVGAGTRVTVRIPMKGVENESDHRG